MRSIWKNSFNRLYHLIVVSMIVLMLPFSVSAAQEDENIDTSLTMNYFLKGNSFAFYKVSDFSENGVFTVTEEFAPYKEDVEFLKPIEEQPEEMTAESWRVMTSTMQSLVIQNEIEASFIEKTDEKGQIVIENIEKGLYLILGEKSEDEEHTYIPSAVLVSVPYRDEQGKWDNHLVIDHNKVQIDSKYDEYHVIKIWNVEDKTKIPESITVHLYMDSMSEPYDTIILNEETAWQYTWKNLPLGHEWTVAEEKVAGYTVKYETVDNNLKIENTYEGPEEHPKQNLPQTGQLWWPVPILAMLGVAIFAIGCALRRSGEN